MGRLTTRFPLTEPLQRVERHLVGVDPDRALLVPLITRLFDPNLPPAWLEALWPATRLVIASVATGLGAERHVRRSLLQELGRFRRHAPLPSGPQPTPSCVNHPFAVFHWMGWSRVVGRQPTPYVAVAGVVLADPYEKMRDGLKTAVDLVVVNVDGIRVRHLLFGEADADWQLWVEDGKRPLPRRLAIVYKKVPGAPRVVATFSDWNLSAGVPSGRFVFVKPPQAIQVELKTAPPGS